MDSLVNKLIWVGSFKSLNLCSNNLNAAESKFGVSKIRVPFFLRFLLVFLIQKSDSLNAQLHEKIRYNQILF